MPHSNSEEIPRLGVGSRQINGVEYSSKRIGSLPDVFCFRITRSAKAKQRRGQRPNQRSWRRPSTTVWGLLPNTKDTCPQGGLPFGHLSDRAEARGLRKASPFSTWAQKPPAHILEIFL